MDDTYTVLKKAYAQEFSDHLNTMDDDIKWTTEGEIHTILVSCEREGVAVRVERSLAFLDAWSLIKDDGSIRCSAKTLTLISIFNLTATTH